MVKPLILVPRFIPRLAPAQSFTVLPLWKGHQLPTPDSVFPIPPSPPIPSLHHPIHQPATGLQHRQNKNEEKPTFRLLLPSVPVLPPTKRLPSPSALQKNHRPFLASSTSPPLRLPLIQPYPLSSVVRRRSSHKTTYLSPPSPPSLLRNQLSLKPPFKNNEKLEPKELLLPPAFRSTLISPRTTLSFGSPK